MLLGFLLYGCASTPPVQFYTLSPMSAGAGGPRLASGGAIGIGPVVFPEFLDRPQIVTRSTSNQIQVDEFHRWGGSVQEDFSRILVQNLSSLLGSNRVHVYPSREQLDIDYRVALDVQQFDGRLGGGVVLNAVWTLVDESTTEPVLVRRFEFTAPASGADYEALVAAHSAALAALSQEIAREIRRVANEPPRRRAS
jgi:uncharacterized lipoprotein YmbA